jgi:hypothetical protein
VLTESEIRFLQWYNLTPDDVFDGRNYSQAGTRMLAEQYGKTLVLGSPCRARGHRLRTRPGHCAQCDPKKIAYQIRFSSPGYVYIAGSLAGRAVKFGSSIDVAQRENQIRFQSYGGQSDWIVLYHVYVPDAARVEHNARTALSRFKFSRPYYKDGSRQWADELLKCSFSTAIDVLTRQVANIAKSNEWKADSCWRYEFE